MTTPVHLRTDYWALPLTALGDQFRNLRIVAADDKWTVPYLRYSYRSIYHTDRLHRDIYCGHEIPLEEGNWQIVCTSKECTAAVASKIVEIKESQFYKDYEYKGGIFSNPIPSLESLLRSKGCDTSKNHALIQNKNNE